MKKLFTTIALSLVLSSTFAAVDTCKVDKPQEKVLIQVKNVYLTGTDAEKQAETKYRKDVVAKYTKLGYTFVNLVRTNKDAKYCNGLYIVMVK